MGKNKLSKFADLRTYAHVFEPGIQYLDNTYFEKRGCWNSSFFLNDNPIVLELGCGKGEYTVGLARMFPDKNFIGVDIKGARMWTGATQAKEEGLGNVAFLRTNIELIDRFFSPAEVSEIWITFPDPQMKKATKRLTSTGFMQHYRNILKTDGLIHLKTDSNFLFTYTEAMAEHNGLPILISTRDLYGSGFANEILSIHTYYEEQWIGRGIPIKYIRFALPQEGELTEPEIEIEPDTYRSFGRNRRCESTDSGK